MSENTEKINITIYQSSQVVVLSDQLSQYFNYSI